MVKNTMHEIESAEVCNVGAFSTALSVTNIFRGRRNIYLEAIRDNIHMGQSPAFVRIKMIRLKYLQMLLMSNLDIVLCNNFICYYHVTWLIDDML